MTGLLGALLLGVAAGYAGVWAWLRGGGPGPAPPTLVAAGPPAQAAAEQVAPVVTAVSQATIERLEIEPPKSDFELPKVDFNFPKSEFEPPKVDFELSKVDFELSKSDFELSKVDFGLPKVGFGLPKVGFELPGIGAAVARVPTGLEAADSSLFSVLIAARNEAVALPRLLAALAAQTLPQFEVLVADDHSTDATAAVVEKAAETAPFTLRLVRLPAGQTGKKAALAAAEAQARAPWVVCTDADCRPGPGWLRAYADLVRPALHFVSGPVRLTPGGAWFDGLLALEFAGLVGVGGACIGRGHPTMCNGANLAFRRATFRQVGGYADNAAVASGDDEFLLHKIHQLHPAGVAYLADARAVVDTPAPATLAALLRQRVRWASKYPHYRAAAPRRLALLVLATNLSLLAGLLLALARPALWPWVGAAWGLKLGADAWLLWPTLGLLARRRWLGWLLPLQLLYAPYALAVGLAGRQGGGYRWKGRQVR